MWAKTTTLYLRRGDQFAVTLPLIGSIVGRTALIFTVKWTIGDVDADALWQITELGGLLISNGAVAADPAQGGIIVGGETYGSVRVFINAGETLFLEEPREAVWDLQAEFTAPQVETRLHGRIKLVSDVTRGIFS